VDKIGLNSVTCGDCLELMARVETGSVDMVLTSPPYDDLRTYKGYSFDFERVARELLRVIKNGGVVIWVVGDATKNGSETGTSFRQALYFKEIGFSLYDTMIYRKLNYLPLTHRRYEQSFEYMFVLSKGVPATFNPIKKLCKTAGRRRSGKFLQTPDADNFTAAHTYKPTAESKIAPNIFEYSIGNEKVGHPAVFPLELATDQINSWSNPNEVCLDPLAGSGTTGVACVNTGRNFIQFDSYEGYCEIASERAERAMAERAMAMAALDPAKAVVRAINERGA
jgi:site-specific DNA-methyltransferase (adenine-specific)